MENKNSQQNQSNQRKEPKIQYYTTYIHMRTNVILTNKRRMHTHAQSNYTNTKLKAWFRRLLRHPAGKRSDPILHPRTHTRGTDDASLRRPYESNVPSHTSVWAESMLTKQWKIIPVIKLLRMSK